MTQTTAIYLLLAAVVAVFGLSFMKHSGERERAQAQQAVQTDAAEAAMQVLARADALPFDARAAATPDGLTPPPFPRGRALGAAQDVDDLHGMAPETYPAADGTAFVATARVEYVDAAEAVSERPTERKRVTVEVSHPALEAPVALSRLYGLPTP